MFTFDESGGPDHLKINSMVWDGALGTRVPPAFSCLCLCLCLCLWALSASPPRPLRSGRAPTQVRTRSKHAPVRPSGYPPATLLPRAGETSDSNTMDMEPCVGMGVIYSAIGRPLDPTHRDPRA